jgi:Flp pilus assembly protein TadG
MRPSIERATYGQRGTIAVATAVSMLVLVAFLGVVVDLGRMYIVKTELQNAADACALAAAKELDGTAGALTRAENAGITVGAKHSVHLQSEPVSITAADIKFSKTLSSATGENTNYSTQAAGAPADSKYAMCTARRASLAMTLTSIVGFGAQTVAAQAVATVTPAQTSCAIPLGMCAKGAAPTFGLVPGNWYNGRFDAGGGITGNYIWIDFDPPAGGAKELAELLKGPGRCNTAPSRDVGQPGLLGEDAAKAWNSRFGLYHAGDSRAEAPPDFTGYAYTTGTWPTRINALNNFLTTQRPTYSTYQPSDPLGILKGKSYQTTTSIEHKDTGANRRLVVAPIVDCAGAPIRIQAYGCVLMLHPIASTGDIVYMEYVGRADDPASPCSTSGLAGGSFGPLVPVLVQ